MIRKKCKVYNIKWDSNCNLPDYLYVGIEHIDSLDDDYIKSIIKDNLWIRFGYEPLQFDFNKSEFGNPAIK